MGRVLVVEDNADIRLMLVELFESEGFDVVACADGIQALSALAVIEPRTCVVLDLMLPVVSGWEVLKSIRALPERLPVIVLSADPAATKADADLVVSKPFDAGELVDDVRRLVRSRAA